MTNVYFIFYFFQITEDIEKLIVATGSTVPNNSSVLHLVSSTMFGIIFYLYCHSSLYFFN